MLNTNFDSSMQWRWKNNIGCADRVRARSVLCSRTSCARVDTICLRPLQIGNIFAYIRQVAPVPACWLFKTLATSWPWNLLTLKVMSESRVTWDISVPILVFLCLSVLELGQMFATDRRQTSDRRRTKASLNASALWRRRHNNAACLRCE